MNKERNENMVDTDKIIDDALRRFEEEGLPIDREMKEKIKRKVHERVAKEISQEILRVKRLKKIEQKKEKRAQEEREKIESFLRFNRNFRFQHMILVISVLLLILTGMPLKYPDAPLMKQLISILGGLESSRFIHRVGASLLIFVAIYHTLYTLLSRDGRRDFLLLIPRLKDLKDFFITMRYYLGKSEEKARFDRFSYVEKFDYWAVYWGCLIMIGSGALLWFENFSLRYLPKFLLDISKEAHSDEALLATLAIVIWHFYNVHFNPSKFPGSLLWWHGRITKEEMIEEHPLEYERLIKAKKEKEEREKLKKDVVAKER